MLLDICLGQKIGNTGSNLREVTNLGKSKLYQKLHISVIEISTKLEPPQIRVYL